MKVLMVVSHPRSESLTWTLCKSFQEGMRNKINDVEFDIIDLYKDKFVPSFEVEDLEVLRFERPLNKQIEAYQRRIDAADAIVVLTPIYWWSLPAMLKGWFDRVLTPGWAYEVVVNGTRPLLKDRPTYILALGATDQEAYARHGYEKAFKTQVEYGIFSYCGIKSAETHVFFSVIDPDFGGVDPNIHIERARQLGSQFAEEI